MLNQRTITKQHNGQWASHSQTHVIISTGQLCLCAGATDSQKEREKKHTHMKSSLELEVRHCLPSVAPVARCQAAPFVAKSDPPPLAPPFCLLSLLWWHLYVVRFNGVNGRLHSLTHTGIQWLCAVTRIEFVGSSTKRVPWRSEGIIITSISIIIIVLRYNWCLYRVEILLCTHTHTHHYFLHTLRSDAYDSIGSFMEWIVVSAFDSISVELPPVIVCVLLSSSCIQS